MLLLPAGQTHNAWEPSDKDFSIADRGTLDRESQSRLLFPQARTRITEDDLKTTAFNTRTKNLATGPRRGALQEWRNDWMSVGGQPNCRIHAAEQRHQVPKRNVRCGLLYELYLLPNFFLSFNFYFLPYIFILSLFPPLFRPFQKILVRETFIAAY